jgi:tetratricopeptide (TPR) repeat protein
MPVEVETEALLRDVERALLRDTPIERLLPLLVELARTAPVGSGPWLLACQHLAARAVDVDPWRASLLSRRVVALCDDHLAWGILGLAQSILGNHRFAMHAYRQALARAPDNPYYAHNLGHLYDVVLDQPERGLALLERAYRRLGGQPDAAASLAHALARAGRFGRARGLAAAAVRATGSAEHHALRDWIDACFEEAVAHAATKAPAAAPRRRRRRRRTRRAAR